MNAMTGRVYGCFHLFTVTRGTNAIGDLFTATDVLTATNLFTVIWIETSTNAQSFTTLADYILTIYGSRGRGSEGGPSNADVIGVASLSFVYILTVQLDAK